MTRPMRTLLLQLTAAAALAGCNYDMEPETATSEKNSCVVDTDCGTQRCEAGRCVTRGDGELNVTLVVTPKRMTSGADFRLVSEPFTLHPGKQDVALQPPASVSVRVHYGSRAMAAQLTFTPPQELSKFVSRVAQLSTVAASSDDDEQTTNKLLLLPDTTYNVVIQPANASLPPHSMTFTASDGATLDVDYAELEPTWQTRLFVFRNAPAGVYKVRARGKNGGPLLSSSDEIGVTGYVSLKFDPSDKPYELELTPIEQATYATKGGASCNGNPPRPILTVDSASLSPDKLLLDQLLVELPKLPESIPYVGTIKLCNAQTTTSDLPITLTTSDLAFSSSSNMVKGRFEVVTEATWDGDAEQHTFCAQVPAGKYTVVVTPPPSANCDVFAESRLLLPPSPRSSTSEGEEAIRSADLLELKAPATLSGTIQTPDRMPMANASIELVAQRKTTITTLPEDRTVPKFNRSRLTTSGATGMFQLPVDLGTYDVMIKPPAQTSFAWRVLYGVDVGRSTHFATLVSLMAPVVVTGNLNYGPGSDPRSLAQAEVHAYTLVDQGEPTERSVEIGRTQADANGNVTLLLPPQLQKSWTPL